MSSDVFQHRGEGMTRLETFVDAAFAFAVTMLVISIDTIPGSKAELVEALQGIPSFVLSVHLIYIFWQGHRTWSQRFGIEDGVTTCLSWALVVAIMCFVYPLKFLMNLVCYWLFGIQANIDTDAFGENWLAGLYDMFAIYGTGFAIMGALIAALNGHALRRRNSIGLSVAEVYETRTELIIWEILVVTGALSTLLALTTPPSRFPAPGFIYWILPIAIPMVVSKRGKGLEKLRETPPETPVDVESEGSTSGGLEGA